MLNFFIYFLLVLLSTRIGAVTTKPVMIWIRNSELRIHLKYRTGTGTYTVWVT
jgi:hypothetical protein